MMVICEKITYQVSHSNTDFESYHIYSQYYLLASGNFKLISHVVLQEVVTYYLHL